MSKIFVPDDVVDSVFRRLHDAGHQAFLVGGLVRDSLVGRPGADFDVATSALPEQVLELFKGFSVPTGLKHGTVTVLTDNDQPVEVTTFRRDNNYADGRHPFDVTFVSTIEEDLARRDFTMNAIAYDPLTDTIVDPFHGELDIVLGTVRAVGDPIARFNEDGLRVMRAIRQACQLGFVIHSDTLAAIPKALTTLKKVSTERLRDELLKTLGTPRADMGVQLMLATGILDIVLPELCACQGLQQNRYHAFDVLGHSIQSMCHVEGADPILKLAVLLHDVGKLKVRMPHPTRAGEFQFLRHEVVGAEMVKSICTRLRLSTEQTARVVHIVAHHMEMHDVKSTFSNAALRRVANRLGIERLPDMFAMLKADVKGTGVDQPRKDEALEVERRMAEALAEGTAFGIKDLAVDGEDVMKICDLKPGAAVGAKLKELLAKVIENPELNTPEGLRNILARGHF